MFSTQTSVAITGAGLGNEADHIIERYAKHDPVTQFVLRIAAGVAVARLVGKKDKSLD